MKITVTLFILLLPLSGIAQTWQELNDKGMQHIRAGNYKEAEQSFLRALQLIPNTGNEYATSLTNLGYCQQAAGNYPAAQQSFREVVHRIHTLFPPLHIERVEAVLNLANAFLPSGQYDSCEHYARLAEQMIAENTKAKNNHYLEYIYQFFDASIGVQNVLASLAYRKGQWIKAASLMEQQRLYIRSVYPDDYHKLSIYHTTLNNLSSYYTAAEEYQLAKVICREHLTLVSDQKNNLTYLYALNNLGSIYRNLEQYDSAILIYNHAVTVLDTGAYQGSDLHIAVLNNQGELASTLEDYSRAIAALHQSIKLQEKRVAVNPRIYQNTLFNLAETYHSQGDFQLAEQTFQQLTQELTNEILYNYTYLSDAEKISFFRANVSVLENFSLFAFELSGDMRLSENQHYISRSAINDLFNLLMTTKGLILHPGLRLKNDILNSSNKELKMKYQLWEDKKYAYAHEARMETADPKEIGQLAYEIETLEKWLRLNSREFQKGFVVEKKTWQDVQRSLAPDEAAVEVVRLFQGLVYGVLILTPSTVDGPIVAIIKSKGPQLLEKQFYKSYANAIQFGMTDSISYKTFWGPIEKVLQQHTPEGKKIARIYFSPDGLFHKINLNTLFNPQSGTYLIDQVEFVHITNMKEVISKNENAPVSRKAVLFGRPQFYVPGKEIKTILDDLPGTEKEVDQIHSILKRNRWKTNLYKLEQASEKTVKALHSPGVVHFATHGFIVQDSLRNDLADLMLNAGVALAGAGVEASETEDGILTAYELMNVDMDNTQLTVLSACETGLGEYYNGEGVYGLQRAIRSAGSKSVIISLWKVDDEATQKLMTLFYETWLTQKKNPRDAFRIAQQELKKIYPLPKYWGAFVFGGK